MPAGRVSSSGTTRAGPLAGRRVDADRREFDTSSGRSYAARTMSARDGAPLRRQAPTADDPRTPEAELRPPVTEPRPPEGIDARLAGLGIAGLSRRRLAVAVGLVVAAWIVLAFGRQLGAASAAQARAEALAAEAERRSAEVAALEAELELIQRPAYLRQQARAYGLGTPDEIPFAIDPNAPPLPADAPGSAATRLGERADAPAPLDVWLTILFGPDPAD
jgi:cell division protein FtsB